MSLVFLLQQRKVPVSRGALPHSPHQGVLLCSLDTCPLTLTEGSLGLGATAFLPVATTGQVAQPLLAGGELPVDIVVVQEVPGAATEFQLSAVGLTGSRWLRREMASEPGPAAELHAPDPVQSSSC